MNTNKNWLVDGSEHFVAKMGYSTSYEEPKIYNVFDNLKFEGETPEVLSYSVNGLHRYAALDKDSGTTNTSNIKMYKDGSFTIEPDKYGIYNMVDSLTHVYDGPEYGPTQVEYVIRQGGNTVTSTVTIIPDPSSNGYEVLHDPAAKLVADAATVVSTNPSGISGDALANLGIPQEVRSNLSVSDFSVAGVGRYQAGNVMEIENVGTILINKDGSYRFTPEPGYTGDVPEISYTLINSATQTREMKRLNIRQEDNVPNVDEVPVLLHEGQKWELESKVSFSDRVNETVDHWGTYDGTEVKTGNLLTGASSLTLDGKPSGKLEILDFTFNGKNYKAGETSQDGNAWATVKSDGTFAIYQNSPSLMDWQSGYYQNQLIYTVSNGSSTVKSVWRDSFYASSIWWDIGDIHDYWYMKGNQNPLDWNDADETMTANQNTLTGNVWQIGDQDYGSLNIQLTEYSINGMKYKAGETAAIFGLGTFTLYGRGAYEFSLEGQRVASIKSLDITYTTEASYRGENNKSDRFTDQSVLTLNLAGSVKAAPYAEANAKANVRVKLDKTVSLDGGIETGNLLSEYAAADKPYISGFRVGNAYYATNQTVEVAGIGWITITRDGSYYINSKDLSVLNKKLPDIAFTVTNGYKASSSTLRLKMGEIAPDDQDESAFFYGHQEIAGNVLENKMLAVSSFKINGISYKAGSTVEIEGVGSFTLDAKGAYKLENVQAGALTELPSIVYTVQGSTRSEESRLDLTVDSTFTDLPEEKLLEMAELTDGNEEISGLRNESVYLLSNAKSMIGGKYVGDLSIAGFSVNGKAYQLGDWVQFGSGALAIDEYGHARYLSGSATADSPKPTVTYTVSNGAKTVTSELIITHKAEDVSEPTKPQFEGKIFVNKSPYYWDESSSADLVIGDSPSSGFLDNWYERTNSDGLLERFYISVNGDYLSRPSDSDSNDIYIGDRLNIDNLSWNSGGTVIKGSSYGSAVEGLRDYLKAGGSEGSDAELVAYVRQNYTKLMDTHPQGGDDDLNGGAGDDIIIGNAGDDTLTGGEGRDVFVFMANSNSGQDRITDFVRGSDKIQFSDVVDSSSLIWETDTRTLKFTGVQDGNTYENSVFIQSASADFKLEDLIG
ncbi:MAG: M10 family metallopeptidase C-terminal domain-containing protein [Neisseria sp.]|uniref:M10 family metallopeptidase C-terminal domain-containing protein n=1 Tax=Neisseria sp. TaxID=192066 RepID=UPI0026DB0D69|nr:M10 family metallopeptidase C-terminal domain-containing protein [Neisseria sp.]MDO4248071.1 M10 family metallopeptidase C-terminal domain-containing protein [Neisseria sp.]